MIATPRASDVQATHNVQARLHKSGSKRRASMIATHYVQARLQLTGTAMRKHDCTNQDPQHNCNSHGQRCASMIATHNVQARLHKSGSKRCASTIATHRLSGLQGCILCLRLSFGLRRRSLTERKKVVSKMLDELKRDRSCMIAQRCTNYDTSDLQARLQLTGLVFCCKPCLRLSLGILRGSLTERWKAVSDTIATAISFKASDMIATATCSAAKCTHHMSHKRCTSSTCNLERMQTTS